MALTGFTSPTHAAAAWTTLGNMSAPAWDGKTLLFQGGQGTLAITPLSDDVIRVRFTTKPDFGRDHSYAVINHDLGRSTVKADIQLGIPPRSRRRRSK